MESNQDTVRFCAWTGTESTGRHYILRSTDGQELVSEAALRGARDATQQLEHLTRAVGALVRRVRELEVQLHGQDDAAEEQDDDAKRAPRAAAVPRQRKRG